MTVETAQFFVLLVGFLAIACGVILQLQLKNHVSIEKVRELDDPKILYQGGFQPPECVLNEEGLRRMKAIRICYGVFAVILVVVIAWDQLLGNGRGG